MKTKTPPEPTGDRWQELCEQGRIARSQTDNMCWIVGGLASEIRKEFGARAVTQYAIAINLQKDTVRDWRRVYDFYERAGRVAFLEECLFITFSHMRLAANKLPDERTAYAFLIEANGNGWTIEECEIALDPEKGGKDEVEVKSKFYNEVVTVEQAFNELKQMKAENANKKIQLVMYEFSKREKGPDFKEPAPSTKEPASV